MATTDTNTTSRNRLVIVVLVVLLLSAAIVYVIGLLRQPPQMGADADTFITVDALYTAVRSRDEKRLTQCQQLLRAYLEAGKLSEEASACLDHVIAQARGGAWDAAAKRLYDFMRAQRREGLRSQPESKKKARATHP